MQDPFTRFRQRVIDERAHGLRAATTASESRLWSQIKGRRLGVQFWRQLPVGGRFIADFLAPARRDIVEVDGGYHALRARPGLMRGGTRRCGARGTAWCGSMRRW